MTLLATQDGQPVRADNPLPVQLHAGGGALTNAEGVLLPSAARSGTTQSAPQTNQAHRGVVVWLDVTANPGGAESLTLRLLAVDPVSGGQVTYALWQSAITAANGNRRLVCYPGASGEPAEATTRVDAGLPLPRSWAVQVEHSGAGPWSYSIGYSLVV